MSRSPIHASTRRCADDRVVGTAVAHARASSTWSSSRAKPDLLRERRHAALEAEQPHRDRPAVADLADDEVGASVRASSKNTSLNSPPPVICTIGRTSTPGWSIGTSRNDRPVWRSDPGSVRATTKHQCDTSASDVHTFWPFDHPLVAVEVRAGLHTFARSEPALGSL